MRFIKSFLLALLGAGIASAQPVIQNVQVNTSTGALHRPSSFEKFIVPSQTGHSGKYLTTNGTTSSWTTVAPGGGGSGDLLSTNNLSDLTNFATARSNLGLVIGTHVQAFDNDLSVYAGITPSANVQSILGAASYAAIRTLMDLEAGTDFLALPTGTPNGSKFLRDDNTWQSIPGGGDMLAANNLSDLVSAATSRTNLGATTIGGSIFTLVNPSAVTFLRLNADNTVTAQTAANFRTDLSLVAGTNVQAYDADLTTYAGITPSANVQTFLGAASYAAMRTQLSLVPGSDVQGYDADLATYAGITPSANIQTFLGAADYAAMRTQLGLVIGTNVQAYDADLDTWAGVTPGTGVATFLATPTGANLAAALTNETGTGLPVFNSDPLILAPNAAMGALEVDVTKKRNTKTATATTHTLTFSATPSAGQEFGLVLTGHTADCVVTIPSSYSLTRGATITTFTAPANGKVELSWVYDGTTYFLAGDPASFNDLSTVTPATGDYLPLYDVSGTVEGKATIADVVALATPAVGTITGLGTGVATALAVNVGSAGAFVAFNGALGTPSSGTLTNATGLPQAGTVGLTTTDSPEFAGVNIGAATDTTIARVGAGQISVEGVNVITTSSTDTLTNKTLDGAGTGNVVKLKGYIYLTHPHLADGTNAVINTTATAITYGHATFSHDVAHTSNYVEYFIQVPEDIDTSVALRARLKDIIGADTAARRYVLASVSVADSAVPGSATLANEVNLDFSADGSGASGDVQTSAWTTLTSWAGALTAGQTWRIRLSRDGDAATEDASTVDSTELGLVIEYGITQ
jgi:hypothetical protein